MESVSAGLEARDFLASHLDDVPARTMLASTVLRRDPREVPRRLRALLLTIDGRRTVRDYADRLSGFGDVGVLLQELYHGGMLELRSRPRSGGQTPAFELSGDSSQDWDSITFGEEILGLDHLHSPEQIVKTLSAETQPAPLAPLPPPGEAAAKAPPAPPPLRRTAPGDAVPPIERQVDALFALLESVRGERQSLRRRIESLMVYRNRYKKLRPAYDRLLLRNQWLVAYGIAVSALLVALLVWWLKHRR